MDKPQPFEVRSVTDDIDMLASYVPVPPYGMLPVNAFVIHADQPVLVDTGSVGLSESFMECLNQVIDPRDLRWLWLTHTDPDHVGNYTEVLNAAPNLRVASTYLTMGKLGLLGLPIDRIYLLNPGQSLDVGDRRLLAVKPPSYDAPESTGFMDSKTHAFFCVDCFGALMSEPAETAIDIDPMELRSGLTTWATVDSPWLSMVDESTFIGTLEAVRQMRPEMTLSSHLPPAVDMIDTLLDYLASAHFAPAFVGPDQAAMEQMLATQAGG
jgi:hypothetical protein